MAEGGTPEPGHPPRPEGRQRSEARSWIIVVLLALVVAYLITFAVENTHSVHIHWVFGTTNNRLIWVIFFTLLLGAVIGALGRRLYGRRRRRAKRSDR